MQSPEQQRMCSIMSCMNNTEDVFCKEDSMKMCEQINVRELLNVCDVPNDIDLDMNPEFIKQHSEKWFAICKNCVISVISASSAFNALELHSVKEQKKHHAVFVQKKEETIENADLQGRLEHGKENELSITHKIISLPYSCL